MLLSGLMGLLLHSAVLGVIWLRWTPGTRGLLLTWIDVPLSLVWFGAREDLMALASLVFGGLWWGAITASLTWGIGRLTRSERSSDASVSP